MNNYKTKQIYIWKCTQSQFDDAYNHLMKLLNTQINDLMMRLHFATSFREVGSFHDKIDIYETKIPAILKNISNGLYGKFEKEIDKNFTITIDVMHYFEMDKVKDVVIAFLDKIDCLCDYDYYKGVLHIRPKLSLSHQVIEY